MSQVIGLSCDKTTDKGQRGLYKAGGIAALIAGIVFRRNIAAEVGIFSPQHAPVTVDGWFELLQHHRFLGLVYLNVFDIVNYALYAVFRRAGKSASAIAATLGIVGITAYFATNTVLPMLSLGDQFAAASTEAQKSLLLAAGQAMLVLSRFGGAGCQSRDRGVYQPAFCGRSRPDLFNSNTAQPPIRSRHCRLWAHSKCA